MASGKTGNTKDRIEETATNVGHRAQEAASSLAHKAQEAGSALGHRAQEAASSAQHRADETISNVGEGMTSLAGQVRQNLPREGVVGSAGAAVANRLEAGGRYLQEHGMGDMAGDFTEVVRRNPMPALCIGFGFGFLLGMVLTRR